MLFGVILAVTPAGAHVVTQLYGEVHQSGHDWELEILFDAGYADPSMRGDRDVPQPTRDWLTGLTAEEHARLTGEARRYLEEILSFDAGGRVITMTYSFPDFDTSPPDFPKLLNDGAYFHVVLRPEREISGEVVLGLASGDHPDLVVKMPATGGERYLTVKPGSKASLTGATAAEEARHPVVVAFVQGVLHVVPDGLDHILFVLGIFLLQRHWKPLLWQSAAFTVAHTITLGLAAAGHVKVSGDIVEPLIALSITALAVENLLVSEAKPWRLWLVFSFGLVHGLGFASVLAGWIGGDGGFLPTLVAANLGVEVGQVAVLIAAWLLTWRWHRAAAWTHVRRWSCVALAATGLWWFAERTGMFSVLIR